jgi:hypothetical protein
MRAMKSRGLVAAQFVVLVIVAILQLRGLGLLARRLAAAGHFPMDLYAASDLNSLRFHFAGTILACGVLVLASRVWSLRGLRLPIALVIAAPLISVALFVQWQIRGLPTNDDIQFFGGASGLALAVGGTTAAHVLLVIRRRQLAEARAARYGLHVAAVLVLLWSLAFFVTEFAIGVSA